jgi:nitrate/nitrite transport system ATP-binding protein
VDFLVSRSRTFKTEMPAGYDRRHPPVVRLGRQPKPEPAPANTIPFPAIANARD